MNKTAILFKGNGTDVSDMRYASGFAAPDDFLFLMHENSRICLVSPLEYDRARSSVLPGVEVRRSTDPAAEAVKGLCAELGISALTVPGNFPMALAEKLRGAGLKVAPAETRLFPEREFKSQEEVRKITASLRAAEAGCRRAIEILRESGIAKDRTLVWQGRPLTSEILRAEVDCTMLRLGMTPTETICAGGFQAAQPHNQGSGVIPADFPVVLDIFPKSAATGYWGDLTRTVVRGKPSDFMRRAYDAVLEARESAKSLIRPGAIPAEIHKCAADVLEKHGFPTGHNEHGDYGFFHGLGHGVGLDIHEFPRLSPRGAAPLEPGIVVTDEPGLYYPDKGGIRLEDMVWISPEGKTVTLTEIEDEFIL